MRHSRNPPLSAIPHPASIVKRFYESLIDLKPALIGTGGTATTAILDGVNAAVGILVGLATLVYLVIRIRKEVKK